ncbi:MAG: hypothetical protein RIQ56_625 [Candidatus Parcubacteria bacterium]|jgi:death-on-curing family protein
MQYPTLQICQEILFPLIRNEMVRYEPAPYYEDERKGIEKMTGTFDLMQRDDYEGIFGKAAYLFCSVIDGHHFSNGNKRLAVALLTYFLIVNGYKIHGPAMGAVENELRHFFPKLQWEEVRAFHHSHEYFFYHLALVIADRKQKGKMTFREEQSAVRQLLEFITV